MSQNLFNYGTEALLVGGKSPYSPAFESLVTQTVEGVQSSNIALTYPRTDVFGWEGGGTQELVTRPRVQLSFSYCFTSGVNERNLGLIVNNAVSKAPALSDLNSERNYYLLINRDHQDMIGYAGLNDRVIAIGNALMTHYELAATEGQPTLISMTLEALNALFQASGSGQPLPAIDKQGGTATTGLYTLPSVASTIHNYFEAQPGNISLTFNTGCAIGTFLSGANACPVQSFGFTIDIPRAEIKDMGWAYPNTRSVSWPITIGIHADAVLNDIQLDALNRFGCPDSGVNFSVGFKNSCTTLENFSFQFNAAKLDSQTFTARIGSSNQVSFVWSLKIFDINRTSLTDPNFYILSSGTAYSSIVFPQVGYTSGNVPLTFNLSTGCFLTIISGPGLLSGNNVFVSDAASTVVVRAAAVDGSDIEDVTVTVA